MTIEGDDERVGAPPAKRLEFGNDAIHCNGVPARQVPSKPPFPVTSV
jgi:hypothetical protein